MIIQTKLDILNIGSPLFKENLEAQHAKVTHLDWKPVAGGNSEFILRSKRLISWR
jgi:hypothetical protein